MDRWAAAFGWLILPYGRLPNSGHRLTFEMKGNTVQHQHHISIVDDDESVREAAVNLFRSMGIAAVAYSSAEEFLASGMIERTSCLVLDVQMPGMGGLKLQSHLESSGRHIPIVFVTAFTDDKVRVKAMEAGAIGFLAKPFREGDLLDGVRSALRSEDAV
jgi:FixJ family two-component response regulator